MRLHQVLTMVRDRNIPEDIKSPSKNRGGLIHPVSKNGNAAFSQELIFSRPQKKIITKKVKSQAVVDMIFSALFNNEDDDSDEEELNQEFVKKNIALSLFRRDMASDFMMEDPILSHPLMDSSAIPRLSFNMMDDSSCSEREAVEQRYLNPRFINTVINDKRRPHVSSLVSRRGVTTHYSTRPLPMCVSS